MANQKTEAADYVAITWRLPQAMLQELRQIAKTERRPVNSQLIECLIVGIRETKRRAVVEGSATAPVEA